MRISDWSSDVCSSDLDLAKELPSIIALLVPLGDNTVAGGRAASVNDALQALGERLERAPLVVELVAGRGGAHPSDRVRQGHANVEGQPFGQGGQDTRIVCTPGLHGPPAGRHELPHFLEGAAPALTPTKTP